MRACGRVIFLGKSESFLTLPPHWFHTQRPPWRQTKDGGQAAEDRAPTPGEWAALCLFPTAFGRPVQLDERKPARVSETASRTAGDVHHGAPGCDAANQTPGGGECFCDGQMATIPSCGAPAQDLVYCDLSSAWCRRLTLAATKAAAGWDPPARCTSFLAHASGRPAPDGDASSAAVDCVAEPVGSAGAGRRGRGRSPYECDTLPVAGAGPPTLRASSTQITAVSVARGMWPGMQTRAMGQPISWRRLGWAGHGRSEIT